MWYRLYAWVVSGQHKDAVYLGESTDHFTSNVFPWKRWGYAGFCAAGDGKG